ncbi:MAG: hypothetical protein R3Y43_07980 [Alphaproteobacteria bacterium]
MSEDNFDYKVIDVSNKDMADYLGEALNSPDFNALIASQENVNIASSSYEYVGHLLQAYLSATGDNSKESAIEIIKDFNENRALVNKEFNRDTRLEGLQVYFAEHLMPKILQNHAQKHNISDLNNIENLITLQESIYMQSRSNQFLTHSFNGALLEDVKEDGLDITQEKFIQEFADLKSAGVFQPYKTGTLCLCELSKATFGYAYGPERVASICRNFNVKQKEGQSLNSFYREGLEANLNAQDIDLETRRKAHYAGNKIIDYYFGNKTSCAIAFIKDETSSKQAPKRVANVFLNNFNMIINTWSLDDELKEKSNQAKENPTKRNIANYMLEYCQKNPTGARKIKAALVASITANCLTNFVRNGNADGYDAPGGKIAAEELAICSFENPNNTYNKEKKIKKEKTKQIEEEYAYETYKQKYAIFIKKGIQPRESLEDYIKNMSAIIYDTKIIDGKKVKQESSDFMNWKKRVGYDNPKSEKSQALDKSVRKGAISSVELAIIQQRSGRV